MMDYGVEAINRHRASRGKISIASKMKVETMEELSIAYTPGVASVCLAIDKDKSESYALTNRGNTVAVVTDGSAVLGLGNIGPEAALPVMEGKSILFKGLADVDAFPICLGTQDNASIIQTVRNLAPCFGGINLEDIAAPRCFEIEESLQDLGIPVFHDDQHGTSIVVLASIINALQVVGKSITDAKFVFSGSGAGGIASTKLLMDYGAKNIILVDSQGIIHRNRTDLTPIKTEMLDITNPQNLEGNLADAMRLADVFIGLSVGDTVSQDMVRSMSPDPIVLAATPIPLRKSGPTQPPRPAPRLWAPVAATSPTRSTTAWPSGRLPRRPGRSRNPHHHSHEAGGGRGAGRAGGRTHRREHHSLVPGSGSGSRRIPRRGPGLAV